MTLKSISVIMCAALMLALFGCSSSSYNDNNSEISSDVGITESAEGKDNLSEPEKFLSSISASSLDGKTIHFMYVISLDKYFGDDECEITYENESGDILRDAVYQRTRAAEELLGCKITADIYEYAKSNSTIESCVLSGDDTFDAVAHYKTEANTLAINGYLYNLRSLDSINLNNPWWEKNINTNYSLNGGKQQYFSTGDILYEDNYEVSVIYFNKNMASDYNLESPYDMLESSRWTMDKFAELSEAVTIDINGDGKINLSDQWGFWCNCGIMANMSNCFGMPSVTFKNGEYKLTADDIEDRYFSANEAVWNLVHGGGAMLVENVGGDYDKLTGMSKNGQFLFWGTNVASINIFRDVTDFDFGVLPFPKYDESQDGYHASGPSRHVVAIISSSSQPEDTALVFDVMGAYSVDILTPNAIEKQILTKSTRDEESEKTLKIIFDSNCIVDDILLDHYWTGIGDWGAYYTMSTQACLSKSFDFVSKYAAVHDIMQKAIDDGMQSYADLMN